MIRIFISYARKHETFARQLATALSNSGAEVWVDIEDIPAGMNWSRAVQEGLDACDVMLVIITPESMQSRNVENEWQYYFDENKPVIPIRLIDAKLHFQLRRMQYIDFERQPFDNAYALLLRELARLGLALDAPSPPAPPLPRHGEGSQTSASSPLPLAPDEIVLPSSPTPLPLREGSQTPADRMTPPLYEVERGSGREVFAGEVQYQPEPHTINTQSKYAAPPKPLRRTVTVSPVLLVGILAALVLGGLVTFISQNISTSAAPSSTQTAAQGTFQAGIVGSAVAMTPEFSQNVAGTLTAAPALPDLIIEDAFILNAPLDAGDTVEASVTIKNVGSVATGAFVVRVNLNGEASDQEQTVENLDPQRRITLTFFDVTLQAGQPEAHFFVDVDQQVDESEEGNNSTTLRYEVVAALEATEEATAEATAEVTESISYTWGFNPDVVRFKNRPLIVYASAQDGDNDLYLYDTGSSEVMPLTVNDCNDRQPSWSPDGQGIIFVSDCDGSDDEIFIFDELGIEQRQVTFDDLDESSPVWIADEMFYYWLHLEGLNNDIRQAWSMTTQGVGISQLTDGIQDAGEVLTASPDGTHLAYTQDIDERPRLVVYDIERRTSQFVGDPQVDVSKPRWSPTSSQIIYVGYEPDEGVDRLTAYNVDSGSYEWWAISHDQVEYPSWNPYTDTLLIAVQVSNGNFTSGLYVFDREEDEADLLIEDETISSPMWRPNH